MRRVRPSNCSSVCPSEHSSGCRGTFVEIYARAHVSLARSASRYGEVRFEHNDRSVVCVCVCPLTQTAILYTHTLKWNNNSLCSLKTRWKKAIHSFDVTDRHTLGRIASRRKVKGIRRIGIATCPRRPPCVRCARPFAARRRRLRHQPVE